MSPGAGDSPLGIAVALSHFHPAVGGAERQILQLSQRWVRLGHRVVVFTRRRPDLPSREVLDGVEIRRTIRTLSLGPLFGLSFVGSLAAALVRARRSYDVLLAAQAPWEAVAAGLVCPRLRKPSLVRIASTGPLGDVAQLRRAKGSSLLTRLVRRNQLFLAQSQQAFDELEGIGISSDKIVRTTNGVDPQLFHPPEAADPANHAADPARERTVVYAGRLAPAKNPMGLLRGWRVANGQGAYRLLVAGDGPEAAALREYAQREALQGVEFLGERLDVADIYRRGAVFALVSPSEGCSNALIEAMASGLCPVVSRVPGNVDLIEDLVTGLLVPPGDDAALGAALRRVLEDSALRQRLATAARQVALARHDLDRIAEQYVELFRRLLD